MNSHPEVSTIPQNARQEGNTDESASIPVALKALAIITEHAFLGHSEDQKPYACMQDGRVMALYSEEMKSFLTYLFYQKHNATLPATALKEALDTASSMAVHEGNEWKLWVRCASSREVLEIDQLGDGSHRIRIKPDRVEIIEGRQGEFFFTRSPDALPLALPDLGGDGGDALEGMDLLKSYINLEDQDSYLILITWAAYSLYGCRGFPILSLVGSAGSGKSETARMLRQLIDPNTLPLGSIASSDREAFIEARAVRLLCYDNIQPIRKTDISDRLAKISTGGGIKPRQLYSDNATNAMFVCNPVITTSIEVPARRPDVVDRMLTLHLQRVPESQRIPANVLEERFAEDTPKVLAGIYVLISKAMVELRSLDPDTLQLPRLADFGLFGIAVERVLKLREGRFMQLYKKAIKESSQGVVEEEPLLQALISLMESSSETSLRLTPKALCTKLMLQNQQDRGEFNAKSVGRKIRLLVEDLQRQGIGCTFGRSKDRYIELTKLTE